MLAPVKRILSTPAVQAIVGNRIYSYGDAPQRSPMPYITWFTVVGDPFLNLSSAPDADADTIQIDCWAGPNDDQELVCINLATAVRDALDVAGIANRLIVHTREDGTQFFRIGLQADFITNR